MKFDEKFFQAKFLSRLSHKVCRLHFLSRIQTGAYDGVMLELPSQYMVYMHYVAVYYNIVLGLEIIVVFFVMSLETCFCEEEPRFFQEPITLIFWSLAK